MALAAWSVTSQGPERLQAGSVDLEKHLEDWIANDIGLIDPGLVVIQRQLYVEGGRLDLLCVDPQGIATVVEIKRGKLIRETIAQAIDYASCIAGMSKSALSDAIAAYPHKPSDNHPGLSSLLDSSSDSDTRDVAIVVVGVGQEAGLERMIDFLGANSGAQIRAVTFDVFDAGEGKRILVREETDVAPEALAKSGSSAFGADGVIAAAGGAESPRGRRLLKLKAAGERNHLHARAYKWSFMLTPPEKRTRCLFVFGRWEGGEDLALAYYADAIAEFYPIAADRVRSIMGPDAVKTPIPDDASTDGWCDRIDELFAVIGGPTADPAASL